MKKHLGILWYIFSLIVGIVNDVLMKAISLPVSQLLFLRYSVAALLLASYFFFKDGIIICRPKFLQIFRGILLFSAITLWSYALKSSSVVSATAISFTIPLITIFISSLLFKSEFIGPVRIIAMVSSFIGAILTLQFTEISFTIVSICFFCSAILFAILDILNKYCINHDSIPLTCFYLYLVVSILSLPGTISSWEKIDGENLFLLFILALGTNLLFVFLLKAYELKSVAYLAPYRYIEIPISVGISYLVFSTIPNGIEFIGIIMILLSTLMIHQLDNLY